MTRITCWIGVAVLELSPVAVGAVAAKETDDPEPPIPKTREKQKAARKDFRKLEGWVTFNSAQGS
jgi:hypothetical protein